MNQITAYSILFFLIVAGFVFYRAYPDNPPIIQEGDLLGEISAEEISSIVKDSILYKEFDRIRKITDITVFQVSSDENSSIVGVLSDNMGSVINDVIYVVTVSSTTKCPRTSYLVFFINSTDGQIMRTKAWSKC